jgi:MFS family permease
LLQQAGHRCRRVVAATLRIVLRLATHHEVPRRAIWSLGAVQCIYWGALYYAFPVVLHPLAESLRTPQTTVAGAFSLGLFAMACAAPAVGRTLDRGHGSWLMRTGAALAVAALFASAWIASVVALYAIWFVLGIGMAMMLYEPAFGLVVRAVTDPVRRVRALATVTVLGGCASTLCIPAIAFLVNDAGWQRTHLVLALAILVGAIVMEWQVLPALREPASPAQRPSNAQPAAAAARVPFLLAAVFAAGTVAAMSLGTMLIAALIERGHGAGAAANALALLGIMQLPGRLWVLSGRYVGSVRTLLIGPMMLQGVGLAVLAASASLPGVGIGVAIFGIGAGWSTLARPMVVQILYGSANAGSLNGSIARLQGFARAAGPLGAAATYRAFGYETLFGGLALALSVLACAVLIATRSPAASALSAPQIRG